MHLRVQQLVAENPGISDHDLMEPMVPLLPGLNQIWTTTTDDALANLCAEFAGFLRYAQVMEDAFAERRENPAASHFSPDIAALPDRLHPIVARVMSQGSTLELEMQGLIDAFQRHAALGRRTDAAVFQADLAMARATAERHQEWIAGLAEMFKATKAADVSVASRQLLGTVFEDVNERLSQLSERLAQVALAGREAVKPGAGQPAH